MWKIQKDGFDKLSKRLYRLNAMANNWFRKIFCQTIPTSLMTKIPSLSNRDNNLKKQGKKTRYNIDKIVTENKLPINTKKRFHRRFKLVFTISSVEK